MDLHTQRQMYAQNNAHKTRTNDWQIVGKNPVSRIAAVSVGWTQQLNHSTTLHEMLTLG